MITTRSRRASAVQSPHQLLLVATPLGDLALIHDRAALLGVELPGPRLAEQLSARWGHAAPDEGSPRWVRRLARRVAGHLSGRLDPFRDVPVDLSALTPFRRAVLEAARAIPPGEVRTYGDLARDVGRPGAARAVGGAMGANPAPLVIPCHRVVAAGGLGGFSGPGGLAIKRALLAAEGVEAGPPA